MCKNIKVYTCNAYQDTSNTLKEFSDANASLHCKKDSNDIYDSNVLTIHCNQGRLGNQMCTYATLHGIAALNHRNWSILQCNANILKKYFEIDTCVINDDNFKQNSHNVISHLRKEDSHINTTINIIKGYPYPCSFTFFNHIRKDIIKDFTFTTEIRNYAINALLEIKGNKTNVTFVGIHVRRTDYITKTPSSWLYAFSGKEVDDEYFERAINYYTNKYNNILFIAVSDDRKWCKENLTRFGVHVMKDAPSPAHDMAILAHCNHTIMTYGTFGFWGSYLANGEVVYFSNFLKPNTTFMKTEFQFENMYLPEWIGISTNSSYKYT